MSLLACVSPGGVEAKAQPPPGRRTMLTRRGAYSDAYSGNFAVFKCVHDGIIAAILEDVIPAESRDLGG